jgi:ornithine carbamoyltransferase
MRQKDLISFADYSAEDLWELLETALQLKREHRAGIAHTMLAGKTLAMIFQKPSLRTRVSFEVGMTQLGGHAIYLGPDDIKTRPARDDRRHREKSCRATATRSWRGSSATRSSKSLRDMRTSR